MPIPDYQTLMLPFLKIAADGQEHMHREAIEILTQEFNLSEEERKELLPSGQQPIFDNRVGWARTYLKKAGLIESSKRGLFKITDKGIEVLKSNPEKINNHFLMQFDDFKKFKNIKFESGLETELLPNMQSTASDIEILDDSKSPEETIEFLVKDLQQQLAEDLLERIKQNPPSFFENLVALLLLQMGYGSSKQDILQNTGKSGDEGIDGIIKEDILGLDKIYIQAKRWQGNVGRPEIQKFVGALHGQNAHKGIFITTSGFSNGATIYANSINSNVVLIDGDKLAELMIRYNLGVSVKQAYEIKKIDEDFFADEV